MKRMIRTPLVRLVDDDDAFRESQREFLKAMGWQVEDYAGAADFLERDDLSRPGCVCFMRSKGYVPCKDNSNFSVMYKK